MRGGVVPGLCLIAQDASGRVVSTASSYRHHHPDSPRADIAHWGMLATREEWRGRKIGLILGAMAIVEMWERFGVRGFMTGIRADNAASQALCNKLGVRATDWVYAQCIDPAVLGGASLTK
jgi:RimJ/RimL family protein N-acetyltransferase